MLTKAPGIACEWCFYEQNNCFPVWLMTVKMVNKCQSFRGNKMYPMKQRKYLKEQFRLELPENEKE